MLLDAREPSASISIRVDSHTTDNTVVRSTRSRRKNFQSNKRSWIDGVQRIASEGSMLTVIAKIGYDVTLDEFTLKDSLGIVGGGLEECVQLLEERYIQFY